MSTEVEVRSVVPGDFDGWIPLWDGYNKFYGRWGPTALPNEITVTTWSRFFDVYEPMHALVAEIDSKIVGLAHYLYHRSTISVQPSCYLQDLYTHETVRGKGIGRALIGHVYDMAERAGLPRVYWQTHEANKTARLLYDKVAENSEFLVYRKTL